MGKFFEELSANKKYQSDEMGRTETEPWFKSKKGGVIPAKRRSVKRMMFDLIVQSFASLFGSVQKEGASPESSKANDKAVLPYP